MSTSSLSKSHSSNSLDSNDQEHQKKLLEQKGQIGDSKLQQSNKPENARDKTWRVAQGENDSPRVPKLRNTRSQPNLFINMDSQPVSSSHTPPKARELNSTPKKPTTSSSTTVPISQSDALSTPQSASSGSSATVALASPKEKISEKGAVNASDLPIGLDVIIDLGIQKFILKPEKLARLLVTIDSQYREKEGAERIKTMLRESLFIINYQSSSGAMYEKLNIIERFCEPFIKHHLDPKKLDELLQKAMREYAKVGEKVTKLSEGLRTVEQVNHPEIVHLMAPTMNLVGDYFFGSDMKLASSNFPDSIKKLFLEIDRQVITRFGKTEGGGMKDQLQLRKSALVGFISTFSFMTIWAPKLAADTKKGAGFYAKLSSYINSYLVNKIDPFVIDILINQEHQSKKVKSYILDHEKELVVSTQSASKLQLVGVEKSGMLSSIKNLFSPRSSSTSYLSGASRETTDEDNDFNEEANRQREMQRKRIVRLTEFAKIAGLDKISTEFFILIRNKIIDLKAKDYNAFTKDPVAYCHQQLEAFKMQKDEKNADSELFKKIEQSINSYGANLEIRNEEKKSQFNSPLLTPDVNPLKKSGVADQDAEKIDATESSSSAVEQKVSADVQTESKPVSEKIDSDSSTSVETEKSDD